MLSQREDRAIPGDDRIRPTSQRAFEDAIVGIVREDPNPAAGTNNGREVAKENGDPREFFGVAREFACKHAK